MGKLKFYEKGFSLFELIIVIAMIAILTTIAIPLFSKMNSNMRLKGSARDIHSLLQLTRLRAIKEQAFVVVDFDPDRDGNLQGNYIAFVDDNADFTRDGIEEIFYQNNLQVDIQMTSAAFGPSPAKTYTCFNINGFPVDSLLNEYSGTVNLSNAYNSHQISLNAVGLSTVQ
ncbi:MAG: prepilin-type N-terminal cleavage/methylation domain-containing protein [Desulfobacula sp.]|uniref:GspH/FimT family pseudopilin n=1 Tax=Desulfobacula sp. TaxID=2593537 RepID=UPI001DD69D20|nr:prepilin-type N-terminal cleavage/methylation domain-containing protein [Desulfobacula sp.]MBT3484599.1 prepilin-type N-terminal cleavage/methylation domain-containing protein [Desulfobacula sp.]MBT3803969.1 prepilin-type N-terminal cleavage/methylation domain-containing protein [Desulfobacula sp.]MBT4023584.1 prepilin-type N-terminal cleavage/methylation domain-containing protein [Desulfobacula sp.]MBT4197748.1 prepilin-type N-terminal cleavage/methylation domain-containing protein [Desulfo